MKKGEIYMPNTVGPKMVGNLTREDYESGVANKEANLNYEDLPEQERQGLRTGKGRVKNLIDKFNNISGPTKENESKVSAVKSTVKNLSADKRKVNVTKKQEPIKSTIISPKKVEETAPLLKPVGLRHSRTMSNATVKEHQVAAQNRVRNGRAVFSNVNRNLGEVNGYKNMQNEATAEQRGKHKEGQEKFNKLKNFFEEKTKKPEYSLESPLKNNFEAVKKTYFKNGVKIEGKDLGGLCKLLKGIKGHCKKFYNFLDDISTSDKIKEQMNQQTMEGILVACCCAVDQPSRARETGKVLKEVFGASSTLGKCGGIVSNLSITFDVEDAVKNQMQYTIKLKKDVIDEIFKSIKS